MMYLRLLQSCYWFPLYFCFLGSTLLSFLAMVNLIEIQVSACFPLQFFLSDFATWLLIIVFVGFTEHVLISARRLDVWGTTAFSIAIFLLGEIPLMVHGTCRNHYIWDGNSGTALVIVDTTVCLSERNKGRSLVLSLSNITGNGHSVVFMGSRFFIEID